MLILSLLCYELWWCGFIWLRFFFYISIIHFRGFERISIFFFSWRIFSIPLVKKVSDNPNVDKVCKRFFMLILFDIARVYQQKEYVASGLYRIEGVNGLNQIRRRDSPLFIQRFTIILCSLVVQSWTVGSILLLHIVQCTYALENLCVYILPNKQS